MYSPVWVCETVILLIRISREIIQTQTRRFRRVSYISSAAAALKIAAHEAYQRLKQFCSLQTRLSKPGSHQ